MPPGAASPWLALLLVTLLMLAPPVAAAPPDLPELGDSGAGLMPPAQERALGQAWLRAFRASVPLAEDPLVFEYLDNLLVELASYSDLQDRRLTLVVVDNPTINAFAVPGGVVGVHTGLLQHATTEAQLASVLTHELAHLSQRHFARSVEASKRASIATIAGLLAGVALAAASSGDAATAAIMSTQAAALDNQLRYSRVHEREADRLGMQSLVRAGYPPVSAAEMFGHMLDASRVYGDEIPEFLRTHPITQSRVADARSRARQIDQARGTDYRPDNSLYYQLMRARLRALGDEQARDSIAHFRKLLETEVSALERDSQQHQNARDAAHYGLALAHFKQRNYPAARAALEPLLEQLPGRIPYTLLDIEIDIALENTELGEKRLRGLYALNPNNYPVGMLLADTLNLNGDHQGAQQVLETLVDDRPNQQDIWYSLAETHGLAGDILNLHRARAEFFLLRANFSQARQHLNYALRLAGDNFQAKARIKQRARELLAIQQQMQNL